jgi:hypothetical protein
MDEFDFTRFEENYNTQYNYAATSEKSAQKMLWLYQAVNQFYSSHRSGLIKNNVITNKNLDELLILLKKAAGKSGSKKRFLSDLAAKPHLLIQWIQAAHAAYQLQENLDLVLLNTEVVINGESYQMQEIIPLNNNQRMFGSSFSDGVHQLMAVRLHQDQLDDSFAKKDVYVAPQNDLISSQIARNCMQKLWDHFEGFSGTITPDQILRLQQELPNGFQVLHMPTNLLTLRHWE